MALLSGPILRLPDLNKNFILRTDASDNAVGFILLQEYEEGVFPIAYGSKKLMEREKKYSTMEKEGLAIIQGIEKFQNFLYGKEFILETDHKPLIFLNKAKFENARIMRWALFLQQYRFTLRSISGEKNIGADFLSRMGT